MTNEISEITRRAVVYSMRVLGVSWSGRLNEVDFLAETAHPVVRPDAAEARNLVATYNLEHKNDGYALVEVWSISNRPIFGMTVFGARASAFDDPTGWAKFDRQFQEARSRLSSAQNKEQFQAVGLLCREALVTVVREAFDPSRHSTADGVVPSSMDAVRMPEAFIAAELVVDPMKKPALTEGQHSNSRTLFSTIVERPFVLPRSVSKRRPRYPVSSRSLRAVVVDRIHSRCPRFRKAMRDTYGRHGGSAPGAHSASKRTGYASAGRESRKLWN